jgi:hypothetical protein
LISSRRAARTPEHLSHVKVMIILDPATQRATRAATSCALADGRYRCGSLWWLVSSAADELSELPGSGLRCPGSA